MSKTKAGPARQRKVFATAEQNRKHEAALERRRASHHARRTAEMAQKAAEGQADFAILVEAEQARLDNYDEKIANARKAGASSPKAVTQARDHLSKAFDLMGGVAALVVWGRENATEFYRLWARLIPKEAAETTTSMPLEQLLEKLATKEEKTVGQAVHEIGMEALESARKTVELEDLLSSDGQTVN